MFRFLSQIKSRLIPEQLISFHLPFLFLSDEIIISAQFSSRSWLFGSPKFQLLYSKIRNKKELNRLNHLKSLFKKKCTLITLPSDHIQLSFAIDTRRMPIKYASRVIFKLKPYFKRILHILIELEKKKSISKCKIITRFRNKTLFVSIFDYQKSRIQRTAFGLCLKPSGLLFDWFETIMLVINPFLVGTRPWSVYLVLTVFTYQIGRPE